MVGDLQSGYMIGPASPEVRAHLQAAAAIHKVSIDGRASIVSSMYATQRFPQCPDQSGERGVRVVLAQLSGIAARSKQ
jgi:hypothetical protein